MAIVALSSGSTAIRWLWLLSFVSIFMSQSCLGADDDQVNLVRPYFSRKLCPSCSSFYRYRYPVAAAQESISDRTGHVAWIRVHASVLSAAAVMVLLVGALWHMSRRNQQFDKEEQRIIQELESQDLLSFPFKDILKATKNFSDEKKIGEGGFGSVYKGILPDGKEIAVKRMSDRCQKSSQGLKKFENEATLMSKLRHKNVVRLLGSCTNKNELILVYEYMPKKSLDDVLFSDSRTGRVLDGKTRINIINGIARGLLYLREYSRFKIIHLDLKPSNVLLDDALNPQISDFGVAKTIEYGDEAITVDSIVGTIGYIAPEYHMHLQISIKSDIYSFGILLLEIIAGRRNRDFYLLDTSMLDYIWKLWCDGQALDLMDPAIMQSYDHDIELLIRYIHVGLLCVQENPTQRPTTSVVVGMLTSVDICLPQLNPPSHRVRSFQSSSEIEISNNDLTLSIELLR